MLDNSSIRSTPAVRAWPEARPRVAFHFTPKGASWMNLLEAWFRVLTRTSVRRGSLDTGRQLMRHIDRYLDHWNEAPTPFVWTKEPDELTRKAVTRYHDFVDGHAAAEPWSFGRLKAMLRGQ